MPGIGGAADRASGARRHVGEHCQVHVIGQGYRVQCHALLVGTLDGLVQAMGTAGIVACREHQHAAIRVRGMLHGVVDGESDRVVERAAAALQAGQRIESTIEPIRIHREPVARRIAVAGNGAEGKTAPGGIRNQPCFGAGRETVHERGGRNDACIVGVAHHNALTLIEQQCRRMRPEGALGDQFGIRTRELMARRPSWAATRTQ